MQCTFLKYIQLKIIQKQYIQCFTSSISLILENLFLFLFAFYPASHLFWNQGCILNQVKPERTRKTQMKHNYCRLYQIVDYCRNIDRIIGFPIPNEPQCEQKRKSWFFSSLHTRGLFEIKVILNSILTSIKGVLCNNPTLKCQKKPTMLYVFFSRVLTLRSNLEKSVILFHLVAFQLHPSPLYPLWLL